MRTKIVSVSYLPTKRVNGRYSNWRKLTLACGHQMLERDGAPSPVAEPGKMRYCMKSHNPA